ncbi:MAG: hypothetical protein P8176_13485, partial [Gammaproteobacteria bacterium]
SDRFNEMLDHCGFEQGRSRAGDVMRFFNKKKSIVYYCLKNDCCPKDIVVMIDLLSNTKRLSSGVCKKSLLIWLTTGEGNPFGDSYSVFSVSSKHSEFINRIVCAINREASTLQVSLSNCSDLDIAVLYLAVINDMVDRKSSKPSVRVIRKLLNSHKVV